MDCARYKKNSSRCTGFNFSGPRLETETFFFFGANSARYVCFCCLFGYNTTLERLIRIFKEFCRSIDQDPQIHELWTCAVNKYQQEFLLLDSTISMDQSNLVDICYRTFFEWIRDSDIHKKRSDAAELAWFASAKDYYLNLPNNIANATLLHAVSKYSRVFDYFDCSPLVYGLCRICIRKIDKRKPTQRILCPICTIPYDTKWVVSSSEPLPFQSEFEDIEREFSKLIFNRISTSVDSDLKLWLPYNKTFMFAWYQKRDEWYAFSAEDLFKPINRYLMKPIVKHICPTCMSIVDDLRDLSGRYYAFELRLFDGFDSPPLFVAIPKEGKGYMRLSTSQIELFESQSTSAPGDWVNYS